MDLMLRYTSHSPTHYDPFALSRKLNGIIAGKHSEIAVLIWGFRHFCSVLVQFNMSKLQGKEVVCSNHFYPECTKTSLGERKCLLKKEAPTVFDWTTRAMKRMPPKKRIPVSTLLKPSQQTQASVESPKFWNLPRARCFSISTSGMRFFRLLSDFK